MSIVRVGYMHRQFTKRYVSEMREIFEYIRTLVVERYSVNADHLPDLPWQGVSAFLFLRFFVPSILNPHLFGFWRGARHVRTVTRLYTYFIIGMTEEPIQRTLTQIAKILLSLANLNAVCLRSPDVESDTEGQFVAPGCCRTRLHACCQRFSGFKLSENA